jgi:hypothetical protein
MYGWTDGWMQDVTSIEKKIHMRIRSHTHIHTYMSHFSVLSKSEVSI